MTFDRGALYPRVRPGRSSCARSLTGLLPPSQPFGLNNFHHARQSRSIVPSPRLETRRYLTGSTRPPPEPRAGWIDVYPISSSTLANEQLSSRMDSEPCFPSSEMCHFGPAAPAQYLHPLSNDTILGLEVGDLMHGSPRPFESWSTAS